MKLGRVKVQKAGEQTSNSAVRHQDLLKELKLIMFLGTDRELHHLCGVPTSPRWFNNSPHCWSSSHSGPFSYTFTALVVDALKMVLSLVCGVSNANCIVNIAITLNFE